LPATADLVDLGVPGRKEALYRLSIHQIKGTVSDFADDRALKSPSKLAFF
jgi:hypothetical protein